MEQMILANPDIDQSSLGLSQALQAVPELKARFNRKLALFSASQRAGEGSQEVGSALAQSSRS